MLLLALTAALAVSCTYDDSAIKQEIEDQGKEIEALKQRVSALEAVQKAHDGDLFITGVTTLENGYIITFSDGSSATIYNGEAGKDGEEWISGVELGETTVLFHLSSGADITIPLLYALSVAFDSDSNITMKIGDTKDVGYTITSYTDEVFVESVSSSDLKTIVLPSSAKEGVIRIKSERNTDEYSKVVVLISNQGNAIMRTFTVSADGEGMPYFELEPSEVEAPANGGDFTVQVKTNIGYTVNSVSDWISEKSSSTSGDITTLVFTAAKNDTMNERTGNISFCADNTQCYMVTVSQRASSDAPDNWSQKEFYHRSLAMRFTATWCGYCPMMNSAIAVVQSQNPDKIEYLAIHEGNSELATPEFSKIQSAYGISSYPSGVMDGRAVIPNYDISTATAVFTNLLIEMESNYPVATGVAISSSLNGEKVDVNLKLYSKVSEALKVTVMLVEDSIIGYQADYIDGNHNDYVHNGVCRASFTDMNGDDIYISDASKPYGLNYSMSVPNSVYDTANLKIMVYVMRSNSAVSHVKNVSNANYGDFGYYVDNAKSVPVGATSTLEFAD